MIGGGCLLWCCCKGKWNVAVIKVEECWNVGNNVVTVIKVKEGDVVVVVMLL